MKEMIIVKDVDGSTTGFSSKYYKVNEITGDIERISDNKIVFQKIKG